MEEWEELETFRGVVGHDLLRRFDGPDVQGHFFAVPGGAEDRHRKEFANLQHMLAG